MTVETIEEYCYKPDSVNSKEPFLKPIPDYVAQDVFLLFFKYELVDIDSDGDVVEFRCRNEIGDMTDYQCRLNKDSDDINTLRDFEKNVVVLEEVMSIKYSRYLIANSKGQLRFLAHPNRCYGFHPHT